MSGAFAALPAIVVTRVRVALMYRTNSIVLGVAALVQILLVNAVWTAAYRSGAGAGAPPLETLLVYVTLAGLHSWLLADSVISDVQDRVVKGTFLFDLVRPVGFLTQMAAQQTGYAASVLLFMLPALPVVLLGGALSPPDGTVAGLAYPLSLGLGFLVHTLISVLIGLSAFWTIKLEGIGYVYRYLSQFMAGAFAPLSMFPGWLAGVADVLPFQAMTYVPVAIYVGELTGNALVEALAVQAGWLVVLNLMALVVWRRAVRKVVVQGG
ncbi:ABC-type uncharacterized transport system permease subunit [Streptomyces sp. DSM 42143]|uniref:ABC transporter permease n=1 Tax=unclassified Streptomyces TaxID=2593676 RepID=UPI0025AEE66C|nr:MULTISPECIES: ABC-2 family transporter protein [unclassified Streptomyces]MDN3255282.1 ABC-2 family transporter protein [Streptomyces sp. MA25(2023)]MDQ0384743.1 ABC-type uncharacterized transport system permease subunit [Streptomyces sp. DSM 42143]